MLSAARRTIVTCAVAAVLGGLLVAPAARADDGSRQPAPAVTATPTAPATPTVSEAPGGSDTPGTVSDEPSPVTGSPSPVAEKPGAVPVPVPPETTPPDDADHENDGPTLPLTRELPPTSPSMMSPLRLTEPEYGPQPVFRLPFAPGRRWGASGSHSDSDGIHRGAIDFAPLSSSDRRVLTVAAGVVYRVTCGDGWFLGVDHGGGWMSEYYHLTSARSSLVGKWVEAGTQLGYAGQTLPCGGTPGYSAHVHLSILNSALDVPTGKRKYVAVSGIQFDNYTLQDSGGAYDGVWRNLAGTTVLTSRGVRCCLTASSRVGPSSVGSTLPDTNGNGLDDYSEAGDPDTDLNSNGLPEVVGFGSRGVYTSNNTGRGFGTSRLAVDAFGSSSGWTRAKHPRTVIDVTGDGRPDVVGFGARSVSVSVGVSGSFEAPRRWVQGFGSDQGWQVGVHQRTVIDVTGDGRPDVVGFGPAGVVVARNTGTAFASPALWARTMGSSAAAGGWTASRHPRMVVDVTGDGLRDLVGFGDRGVIVARNTGSGFARPALWISSFGTDNGWTVAHTPRYVTDIDGDGRRDVVGFGGPGVWVARGTGSAFAKPVLWSTSFRSAPSGGWRGDRHPRALSDVNGDGRLDIVGFADAGTFVALNRGSSFAPAARWTADFGAREWTLAWMPRAVVDVNGDGRADIVGFARDGVHTALSSGSRFRAATHWTGSYGWDASSRAWRVEKHPRVITF